MSNKFQFSKSQFSKPFKLQQSLCLQDSALLTDAESLLGDSAGGRLLSSNGTMQIL